jgi:phenylalanyl-tRNA synthetase beta chain
VRIVYSWLRELVGTDHAPEDLAELLAGKGLHPESIERPWDGLEGVVVARVIEVRDHPGSETLCLARVQTGSGELEVVVGIRNMVAGDLVPLAPPGARVPALPEPLAARTIRGVVSNGMLCSPRELGIADVHTGILILNHEDLEPGTDLKAALGLDDAVLDLEIESNRPDLLSVAAATVDGDAGSVVTVVVKDPDACPRYLMRSIGGLGEGATPLRIQARLTAAGMRPISAVVDATNYVMLELGQPLHAFDLGRVAGPGIVVRRASAGERMVTLDDVERTFEADDLLICDLERPVGIGGVMGGATAEVDGSTRDVLLESAYFEPRGVLRTSRRLNLLTEASIRFSRGTDPEGVDGAALRAAGLMVAWSGAGHVLAAAVDVGDVPPRRSVHLGPERATALLGYAVTADDAAQALARIQVTASADADGLTAEIPSFRPDLIGEVDLIEEVVRVRGYERLPSTLPAIRQPGGEQESYRLRRRIRGSLRRAGLREAVSLSFASPADLELFGHRGPVAVANPPSADTPFLRASLLPALLTATARNLDRGVPSVGLFEVGHVFRSGDPVDEREHVAAVMAGRDAGLGGSGRELDALDAKGALEALTRGLGIAGLELAGVPPAPWHPGRSGIVRVGGADVGIVGELLPSIADRLGIDGRAAAFEVDVNGLEPALGAFAGYRSVSRFPPVRRDLAFLVPEPVAAGAVEAVVRAAGGDLLDRVILFDVFEGTPLEPGTKSLAFSLELRAADRTLEGAEADHVVARVVAAVGRELGGVLRSGDPGGSPPTSGPG